MEFNQDLISQLRNGEIIVENMEYSTVLRSELIQGIFWEVFQSDPGLNGDSEYYTMNLEKGTWTADINPENSKLPVVPSTDFLITKKPDNYEIY